MTSSMEEPDSTGRFGEFGGRYIPESLMPACLELEAQFRTLWADPAFHLELETMLRDYGGRPSSLYDATNLSE
ncbi:MAG: tryptophan synthase beta chain, partial [Actinomycetota bacterium]|nr:tryptophan synthase beta chain [Actinomycetota bacterium]